MPDPTRNDRWLRGHEAGANLASAGGGIALSRRQLELAREHGDWTPESIQTLHVLFDALSDAHKAIEALAFEATRRNPGEPL